MAADGDVEVVGTEKTGDLVADDNPVLGEEQLNGLLAVQVERLPVGLVLVVRVEGVRTSGLHNKAKQKYNHEET